MSLWSVLAIMAGSIAALVVLNIATGGWVTTIFAQLIQAFRHLGQIVFDHLPKPFKLLIVVLLIGTFAGLIYNYTVGVTNVCYQNDVVTVPFLEGLALKINSADERISPTDLEEREVELVDSLNNVTNVIPGIDFNVVYPVRPFLQMFRGDSATLTGYEQYLVNQSFGRQPAYIGYDVPTTVGTIGKALFITASVGDVKRYLGPDSYTKNNYDVWTKWWSKDIPDAKLEPTMVSYSICYDKTSHTCTMQRDSPGFFGTSGCDSGQVADMWDGDGNLYKDDIGSIQFTLWPETNKLAIVTNVYGDWYDPTAYGAKLEDCSVMDMAQVQAIKDEVPLDFARVYRHMFLAEGSDVSTLNDDLLIPPVLLSFFSCESASACKLGSNEAKHYSVQLYGVARGLLMRGDITDTNSSVIFTNTTIVLPDEQEIVDQVTFTDLGDIFASAERREQGQYDLIKYSCNLDTPDKYDTEMTVAGINPFDKLTIMFAMAIGLLFGFVGWVVGKR